MEYLGNIHENGIYPTMLIHVMDGNQIELTHDHYIKTNKGFMHANKISLGDKIITRYGSTKVINVTQGKFSHVVSPLTRSGTIIVNNITLSCYATDRSHDIANIVFIPVRIGLVCATRYFQMLVSIYRLLPYWAKIRVSSHTII